VPLSMQWRQAVQNLPHSVAAAFKLDIHKHETPKRC
jgi:hypothetical protein